MQNKKTYIIAEAGVNHNGDMELAKELIRKAAKVGADAVKFQTFQADKIVHPLTPKAHYQKKNGEDSNQYQLLKSLELSKNDFLELKKTADQNNIQFLSTPFDIESLEFLIDLNLPYIKVSSGDLTYGPLLLKIAQHNKNVLISTGMANLEDIWNALYVLAYGYSHPTSSPKSFHEISDFSKNIDIKAILRNKVTIFHCTSEYPAPLDEINLNVLDTFKKEFGLDVGYSDHSLGTVVPPLAVAKGATFIEKHITLDNDLEGPDHKASLSVEQFDEMVKQIRLSESILGSFEKTLTPSEEKNKLLVRRGIYTITKINKDQQYSQSNLVCLRPEKDCSPMKIWDILGTTAERDLGALDPL